MNPQDPNQILQTPKDSVASDIGPRTWIVRMTGGEMMSGIGVMATAILALLVSFIGYLPRISGQFPVAAAIVLSLVGLPLSAYLWFITIRRMRWEHRNGGILKKSLSGGGILVAFFLVGIIVIFFVYS